MQTARRTIAAAFVLAAAILVAPAAVAEEADAAKMQDRVSEERFSAPALVEAPAITADQLAAHGAGRAGKEDRLAFAVPDCQASTWPAIPLRCLFAADGVDRSDRQAVRTITVETRVGENTSILTRMPATLAQR